MKKQLTLGELIAKLEKITHYEEGYNPNVSYDFGTAVPTTLECYRGYYDQLALGYALTSYDATSFDNQEHPTLLSFLEYLKSSLGTTLEAWKGGDYIVTSEREVWADNPGNVSGVAIVGVKNYGYHVKLITRYRED